MTLTIVGNGPIATKDTIGSQRCIERDTTDIKRVPRVRSNDTLIPSQSDVDHAGKVFNVLQHESRDRCIDLEDHCPALECSNLTHGINSKRRAKSCPAHHCRHLRQSQTLQRPCDLAQCHHQGEDACNLELLKIISISPFFGTRN